MELFAKNFAVVAIPGIAKPLDFVPADYEKRLVKNDFAWAAKNRDKILAEWTKRYDGEVRAEVKRASAATASASRFRRASPPASQALRQVHRAVATSRLAVEPGELVTASSARRAAARRRCCASSPGWKRRTRGRSSRAGATSRGCRRCKRDYGIVFQSVCAVPEPHGLRQRRLRARSTGAGPTAQIKRARRRAAEAGRLARQRTQVSGAASGGQQQRIALARALATSPGCCCSTSRCRRSMRIDARAPARRDPRAAAAARRDDDHGDARPGRGAVDGRPDRGDEPGRDRAGRHAAARSIASRRRRSSPTSSARSTCSPRSPKARRHSGVGDLVLDWRRSAARRCRAPGLQPLPPARGRAPSSTARSQIGQRRAGKVIEGRVPRRVLPRDRNACRRRGASRSCLNLSRTHGDELHPGRASALPSAGCRQMRLSGLREDSVSSIAASLPVAPRRARLKPLRTGTDRVGATLCLLAVCLALAVFLLAPLAMILAKSACRTARSWGSALSASHHFQTPALRLRCDLNTASGCRRCVTRDHDAARVHLRLRALTRSCMPLQGAASQRSRWCRSWRPSLLAAISFIFVVRQPGRCSRLPQRPIRSTVRPGIYHRCVFATFPHALMIVLTALLLTDGRLYEAADSLGTPALRKFLTITVAGR